MQFDSGRLLGWFGAAGAALTLNACAADDGVDANKAGLRGPIEARGPATAGETIDVAKKSPPPEKTPPFMHHDRERDRWYYYDEQSQTYRWEDGEPKK